ncbi:NADH-quinone oxidoreductase subunit B, partial [Streptomyces rubiginosohelvolus]
MGLTSRPTAAGQQPGPEASSGGPAAPQPVLLPEPKRLGLLSRLAPEPMKVVLNWGRRYSLWVFNFGLA